MDFLTIIERVASKIAPGRAPLFTEAHVIKAIEEIGVQGPIGRMKLSKILGLGEGTTRTLAKHLTKEKLIEISKSGIELSDQGKRLFSTLRSRISEEIALVPSSLTISVSNIAVLVKDVSSAVKCGLEQRDAAILTGAHGATTLIFSKNRLKMPGTTNDVFKGIPTMHDTLLLRLNPEENDVIIIGSAENRRSAELGAKMAAYRLLKSIRTIQ